ncbi:DUF5937 family protein [Streptomyces coeruleofuscus]|uniref:DUF5937 family protein n=1 Tax=Streptomyces coeruleofuscus TaxID=66879 RepID=UPI0031F7535F
MVLDLGGLGAADLAAGPSALSELMASLHVLAEPEHHPEAPTGRSAPPLPAPDYGTIWPSWSVWCSPCSGWRTPPRRTSVRTALPRGRQRPRSPCHAR